MLWIQFWNYWAAAWWSTSYAFTATVLINVCFLCVVLKQFAVLFLLLLEWTIMWMGCCAEQKSVQTCENRKRHAINYEKIVTCKEKAMAKLLILYLSCSVSFETISFLLSYWKKKIVCRNFLNGKWCGISMIYKANWILNLNVLTKQNNPAGYITFIEIRWQLNILNFIWRKLEHVSLKISEYPRSQKKFSSFFLFILLYYILFFEGMMYAFHHS